MATGRSRLKSRKDEWRCKLCNDVFKDEKAEILECEYCEEHICRKCLNLTAAEYKLLSKRSDMHWYCPPCEPKAIKNLKLEKGVEERCKEYFQKLEERMTKLESKIDDKPSKDEVKEMVKESVKEATAACGSEDDMEKRMLELRQSEARKNNVVIYGMGESESEDADKRNAHDSNIVDELCSIMDVNSREIEQITRMGKRPDPGPDAKARPVKVEFKRNGPKTSFMRNLKNLSSHAKFKKVSITHDMTLREREENKKRVQEAKDLNASEESENIKHIVVGPPWDRRVARVRKKTE